MEKSADAFRTIGEAAEDLDLPQHVLRFWETRFPQIKPLKRGGGRRYYRPDDVELLRVVKQLLYGEGYTIKGVQRLFREQGARAVAAMKGPDPLDLTAPGAENGAAPPRDEVGEPKWEDEPRGRDLGVAAEAPKQKAALVGLAKVDRQALQAALADIEEGERLLSLARGS